MKNLLIIILFSICIVSCESKKETDPISDASSKLIAEEIGSLRISLATIKNQSANVWKRRQLMDDIYKKYPEYLGNDGFISVENSNKPEFDKRVKLQEQFITAKWKKLVSEAAYKKSLEGQSR